MYRVFSDSSAFNVRRSQNILESFQISFNTLYFNLNDRLNFIGKLKFLVKIANISFLAVVKS